VGALASAIRRRGAQTSQKALSRRLARGTTEKTILLSISPTAT
jgi:hypothetical protein